MTYCQAFCELSYRSLVQVEEPQLGRSAVCLPRGLVAKSLQVPWFTSSPSVSNLPQDSILCIQHQDWDCILYCATSISVIRGEVGQGRGCICQEDQAGGIKKENFDHATPMAVVLRTVAAQHRAHQAEPASPRGFYILLVSSGLRASPFLVSTPAID